MTAPPALTPRRFPADGPLFLAEDYLPRAYDRPPSAGLLAMLLGDRDPCEYRLVDGVAVVDVQGPLDQRGGWWWDGYEAICERAQAAFTDPKVKAVVLALDSPGGVAAGNLACARMLRAMADETGRPLVAHAGTIALSAAYAIACAADKIVVTDDGAVGSVGTIQTVYDRTQMTADAGLDVRVVRSGPLKADPHPDVALTDASVARVRARINELAQSFAAWVAERRGQTAESVLAHQGATIFAPKALDAGLADQIGPLGDAVALARSLAAEGAAEHERKKMDEKQARALAAICDAVGEKDPDAAVAKVQAAVTQAAELPALRGRLAALDAERFDAGVASALDRARHRGALTPAMEVAGAAPGRYIAGRIQALDLEGLAAYLDALPAHVPTQPVEPAKSATQPGKTPAQLTDRDRALARAVNVPIAALEAVAARDAERRTARED